MQVLSAVRCEPSSWEVTEADAELMYAHVLPSLARFFSLQVAAEAKWPSRPAPASIPSGGRLVCVAAAPAQGEHNVFPWLASQKHVSQ